VIIGGASCCCDVDTAETAASAVGAVAEEWCIGDHVLPLSPKKGTCVSYSGDCNGRWLSSCFSILGDGANNTPKGEDGNDDGGHVDD
jgi:hypothetical protein